MQIILIGINVLRITRSTSPRRTAGVCVKSDRAFVTEREAAAGPWQAELADGRGDRGAPIVDSWTRSRAYLIAAEEEIEVEATAN